MSFQVPEHFSVPCIVCEKPLGHVFDMDDGNQPGDGICAQAYGQYGCTVFDPLDGSYLEFNVCDECLVAKAEKGMILIGRSPMNAEEKKDFGANPLKYWRGPAQFRYHVEINES